MRQNTMRIKIKGEITISELIQLLYEELHRAEDEFSVRHTMGATLYINPTNGFGDQITPQNQYGKEVKNLYSHGVYRSAADDFSL